MYHAGAHVDEPSAVRDWPGLRVEHRRGASSEKAERELGWSPQVTSWRQGFLAAVLGELEAAG